MPNFTSYVETEVDLEIEIDEFIDHCSSKDIKEIIDVLIKDGHLPKNIIHTDDTKTTYSEKMWCETLEKLRLNRFLLTNEEIETIEKMANRF
jgi:hypothetical protein